MDNYRRVYTPYRRDVRIELDTPMQQIRTLDEEFHSGASTSRCYTLARSAARRRGCLTGEQGYDDPIHIVLSTPSAIARSNAMTHRPCPQCRTVNLVANRSCAGCRTPFYRQTIVYEQDAAPYWVETAARSAGENL